ncbi:hypothetical protein [Effusibacillus pohliae]|uniref:hypothetical protein n=1 Tax=Effusibacillus pohliae TaxID=232270 RepID=UPI00038041B9|nr:hypothetical protein [Effusibacillus pohliae]
MLQQAIGLLRYSLEGALKRILYVQRRPLSEAELEAALAQESSFCEQWSREPLRVRMRKALQAPHGAFVQKNQLWTLREAESDEVHNEIYALFSQSRVPMKQGEILRILQQRTQRSKGELMSRVNLESDWRFARLEEGEWVLTEWDLETLYQSVETGKEERKMNQHTDLIDLIAAEMEGFKAQLQQRVQEIPREVVEKFNLEDLQAIEHLMAEKKRIAGFLGDLEQLLDKWSHRKQPVNV